MVSCPLGGTRIRTDRPSGIGRFPSCLGGSQWRGQYHQSWVMMRGSSQNIKCHIFNPCLVPSHKLTKHFPPKLVGYMNFQTLPACNTRIPLGTSSAWQNPPRFFFPEARTNAGSVRATQPAAIRDPSTPNSKPPHFSWEVHLQLNTTCHYLPWGISLASGDEFFALILSLKTTPIGCFEPPISEICVSQIWWWNAKEG